MHNNNDKPASLLEVAAELNEVCDSLNALCEVLKGGGIIQARDVEPSLANAVPRLRKAVDAVSEASAGDTGHREIGKRDGGSASPLLI